MQRQDDGCLDPFPVWDDVRTFDGTPWTGRVDVVSGGFPCQDISAAGKGAGIAGERSGLWGEMARIIREVGPRYVFVENSPMLTSRGLGVVLGDLAEMGFDARWCAPSTHHVGAPHKRDRIWIVAHSDRIGRGEQQECVTERGSSADTRHNGPQEFVAHDQEFGCGQGRERGSDPSSERQPEQPLQDLADTSRIQQGRQEQRPQRERIGPGRQPDVRDSDSDRKSTEPLDDETPRLSDVADPSGRRCGEPGERQDEQPGRTEAIRSSEDVADSSSPRPQGSQQPGALRDERDRAETHGPTGQRNCPSRPLRTCEFCGYKFADELGRYGCPNCCGEGLDAAGSGRNQLSFPTGGSGCPERGCWWQSEPDVGRVAHGVAARVDRLKAIGNGQVPALAALAWRIRTDH